MNTETFFKSYMSEVTDSLFIKEILSTVWYYMWNFQTISFFFWLFGLFLWIYILFLAICTNNFYERICRFFWCYCFPPVLINHYNTKWNNYQYHCTTLLHKYVPGDDEMYWPNMIIWQINGPWTSRISFQSPYTNVPF